LAGSPRDLRVLRERIAEWSPDIVHLQFAVAAFGARLPLLLRLLGNIPGRQVVTAHEVTRDLERMGWLGHLVYRRIVARASCVMVHTKGAAKALLSISPETKVEVLPHPVLPAPPERTSEAELRLRFNLAQREVILMFGFIHPQKGLDDLVRAFSEARRIRGASLDRLTLVVAGEVRRRSGLFRLMEVPDRLHAAQVRKLVRRRGLEDATVFTGYVSNDDIAGWFKAANTVVLPYRKTEQSGVLSLARAFAAPVIVSDAGGFGEEEGIVWTFPAGDVNALAVLLSRLDLQRPVRASAAGSWDLPPITLATCAIYRNSLTALSTPGS
jgi:glycosyltransferase involved in cell wall biosynthesis